MKNAAGKSKDAKKRAPLTVCALTAREADQVEMTGERIKCSSGRHPHYSSKRAKEMVAAGICGWVGKHRQRIKFLEGRSLMKVYRRTGLAAKLGGPGEPTMQLVRGGALR